MSKSILQFESEHDGEINDCQFDFYGLRMASVDSSGFLYIYSIENNTMHKENKVTVSVHSGPAWQVAWAHPKYESVIATCGYDHKVVISKESNNWQKVHELDAQAPINCIAWAPWEYGLILAAGSADGRIHILQKKQDDTWITYSFVAHNESINGISWGPPTEPCLLSADSNNNEQFNLPPKRLVSGSSDNFVKLWEFKENTFELACDLGKHDDWVRDVAWCNNIGLMYDTIATCSEDKTVKIWKHEDPKQGNCAEAWTCKQIVLGSQVPLWKVSWSPVGNMLAVSGGDNQVHVFTEQANGEWSQVHQINEEGSQEMAE